MDVGRIGESALGKWAKKAVGNVVGWGADLLELGNKKDVAKTVTETLETIGLAKRVFDKDGSSAGLMRRGTPTVSFEGVTYPKQRSAKAPKGPSVTDAEKMDKAWELKLMSDYYVQTRFTPKAQDIAGQVKITKV